MLLFNEPATTELYTLSLHDALPILGRFSNLAQVASSPDSFALDFAFVQGKTGWLLARVLMSPQHAKRFRDRKSTRLNSSHSQISYAVFCLKKKKHNSPRLVLVHAST